MALVNISQIEQAIARAKGQLDTAANQAAVPNVDAALEALREAEARIVQAREALYTARYQTRT